MKRKKKTILPRVTLLAYSRKDLVAFVQAVETLRLLVEDLRAVQRDLSNAAVGVASKARRSNPSKGAKQEPSLTPTASSDGKGGVQ